MSSLINPCDSRCLRMQAVSSFGHGDSAMSNGNITVSTSTLFILPLFLVQSLYLLFSLWLDALNSSSINLINHGPVNTELKTALLNDLQFTSGCFQQSDSTAGVVTPTGTFKIWHQVCGEDFVRRYFTALSVPSQLMLKMCMLLFNHLRPGRLIIYEQTLLLKTTDLVPVGSTAAVACNAICPETSQHQHHCWLDHLETNLWLTLIL